MDLMPIFHLKKIIDQLVVASNVHWYGHVLRMKDGHVFRRALEFEVGGEKGG